MKNLAAALPPRPFRHGGTAALFAVDARTAVSTPCIEQAFGSGAKKGQNPPGVDLELAPSLRGTEKKGI